MSTLEARRACRARRRLRLLAGNLCRCGQPMDRIGTLCQSCAKSHARITRQRYRTSDYGSDFTVSLIQRSLAQGHRGMQ